MDQFSTNFGLGRIAAFLFNTKRKPLKVVALRYLGLFLPGPIVIGLLSYQNDVVMIEKEPVGLVEDYLFLVFALLIAPALPMLMKMILNRLDVFVTSIKTFVTPVGVNDLTAILDDKVRFIQSHKNQIVILGYVLGAVALSSNLWSVYHRPDGWNSSSHPAVFGVVAVYLAAMFFFVLPRVVVIYLLVIHIQIKILKDLDKGKHLEIKPISPDKSGGLKSLGDLALGYSYFLLPLVAAPTIQYFTWESVTLGFCLGLAGLSVLTVVVFFYPLGVIHKAMKDAKDSMILRIGEKYTELNRELLNAFSEKGSSFNVTKSKDMIDLLDKLYERTSKMPVWPFDTETLIRFFGVALGPLVVIFLEVVIQRLMPDFMK